MVPCGPSINSVWFLPVQTALFSTLCDLDIPCSAKLSGYLSVACAGREEGREIFQLFEAREGAGSIKSGDRKSPAQPDG